jgi:hypothetical protein
MALNDIRTHVVRVHNFGTRRTAITSAATPAAKHSASGIGPRSVWEGPRQRPGGAPVLKRPRTA